MAVDVQGAEAARPYAEGKPFTTVVDSENLLASRFGFTVVPNGILLDEEGKIRFLKQRLWAPDPEHVRAVEHLLEGKEPIQLEETNPLPPNARSLEKQLAETKYKLSLEYLKQNKKEEALRELDEALAFDPDNFVIRKQRWYIRYPEKFIPTIDFDWQQQILAQEKEEEAARREAECGPEGCAIPRT